MSGLRDEIVDVPAGLTGVAAVETEISDVLGARGYFHYRGQSAPDLASQSSFREVAALVLGTNVDDLDVDRSLADAAVALLPTDDIRTALSAQTTALDLPPLFPYNADAARADAARVIAVYPTLLASLIRGHALEPDPALDPITDFLRMVHETEPSVELVRALSVFCTLTIDHGLSNSAFAVRVVASTGADLGACLMAGMCSLSGPKHGALLSDVIDMFDAVGTPANAEEWLRNELREGRRLRGFGHSVYRVEDPRLGALRAEAKLVAPERAAVAQAVETAGASLLAGRRLGANLDLYAPIILEAADIPRQWFWPAFALGRIVGWSAHAIEQAAEQKVIFRPAARYVGPPPVDDIYD